MTFPIYFAVLLFAHPFLLAGRCRKQILNYLQAFDKLLCIESHACITVTCHTPSGSCKLVAYGK